MILNIIRPALPKGIDIPMPKPYHQKAQIVKERVLHLPGTYSTPHAKSEKPNRINGLQGIWYECTRITSVKYSDIGY
jgi:hypothetical protein